MELYGFIRLSISARGRGLWENCTFELHKIFGIFGVAEGLLLSKEGLCSVDTNNLTKDIFCPYRSKQKKRTKSK